MIEETQEQKNVYATFRLAVYASLLIEMFLYIPLWDEQSGTKFIANILQRLFFFGSPFACKVTEIVLCCITCIGTKAKKTTEFNLQKMVIYPIVFGLSLIIIGLICQGGELALSKIIYVGGSAVGLLALNIGLDNTAKYMNHNLGDDQFNFENESFEQNTELEETPYSVNIPMIFYWKKKMRHGWINITNPFRGTWVVGTPGSGKTYSIIEPMIRQQSKKGFAMVVYDYKFPTLAKKTFYNFLKNRKYGHTPPGCTFRVVNFTDVEYSNRVNPIQKKYIPNLIAASETAATLLESLGKGSGEKGGGGSDLFFKTSSENFLAAIIYFFINYHPCGYYKGERLQHCIDYEGKRLYVKIQGWDQYLAYDEKGDLVLDFTGSGDSNESIDENGNLVNLNGHSYVDENGQMIIIQRSYYINKEGEEVEPDTITGEYSDMPHVLSFLSRDYSEIFTILMQDQEIKPLMAPFQSAFDNKAMDQLEGMVGTLRVQSSRLATKESYWVFSGDEFDLKVSDPKNPCYLIIANDPEMESVVGALNALILNRLVTRVNSGQGKNIPVSIIVDELPTLYFHKIDRLIGTARSNKVAVAMGFQELPQLEADYGKVGMQKVITTCGNVICGSARAKETLEWLQNDVFGKAKQISKNVSINEDKTSISLNEKMDNLVPAAKIADMATGWLCGQTARDFSKTDEKVFKGFDISDSPDFKTTKFFCKTHFDAEKIKKEEEHYQDLPKIYTFADEEEKNLVLTKNFNRINKEVDDIIKELIPTDEGDN